MKDKNNYYNDETFEAIYQKMREKFAPTPVTYTPVDEQTLAERISKVLRPMYDKAIAALFKMGSSTYVTDVKRRQDNATAEGARDLESDYGAKMADQLYKAMEGEREKQLEVEKFNAQQKSAADAQAFEAAKVMYEAYLAAKKRHGGGGGGSRQQQRSGDSETKSSLAQAVAAARGKLPASPNGPGFYATANRETVRRTMYSDLPRYVRMRNQMNGPHRASELQKFRNMYKQ